MDSRTNPLAPNLVGDDSRDGEIAGENEPLKMTEGNKPPPGALDYASPDSSPTENRESDPGLIAGSRDPDVPHSLEDDDRSGDKEGGTPYDAEGTTGSAGQ